MLPQAEAVFAYEINDELNSPAGQERFLMISLAGQAENSALGAR
jgi:hypothetical protein